MRREKEFEERMEKKETEFNERMEKKERQLKNRENETTNIVEAKKKRVEQKQLQYRNTFMWPLDHYVTILIEKSLASSERTDLWGKGR